jgi:hypothetical protein
MGFFRKEPKMVEKGDKKKTKWQKFQKHKRDYLRMFLSAKIARQR